MVSINVFVKNNLFLIPLENYGMGKRGQYVLYSPLAHHLIVVDEDMVCLLGLQLAGCGKFTDSLLQKQLLDEAVLTTPNYVTDPNDVFALTILPNNICNFSCSYCYASKGHGKDELTEETLRTVLDFFVSPTRIHRRDLYISFGGGGEPFISWEKVKFVMEYSDALAKEYGFHISYSFASNGSIMNDEILTALKRYNVKANISFDILEDIQNIQRKNYDLVCKNLDTLLDNGIFPTINSVITPLNVERQVEMVEQVHQRFPKLRRLSFDYVVDANLYALPGQLMSFYDAYIDNFFKARALGKKYNIVVSSIKYHNLEQIKMRACAGGFDLTPNGKFSMCFFVSSPNETLYDSFIYGAVNGEKIEFDKQKFKSLVEFTDNDRSQCHNCFLKWHCGGGCFYHVKTYTKEMLDVMCQFQRKFSLRALLDNIEN